MSTRGLIAIMDDDGSCRSIYCHHDMYPSHAGVVLPEHYATRETVEALLALGDLSALGCSLAECEAYCRDRGEELHTPTHWSDRWVLAREAFDRFWANYCYLFMDGGWFCSDGGGWTPVADWLELKENPTLGAKSCQCLSGRGGLSQKRLLSLYLGRSCQA